MKIAPSILAADWSTLKSELEICKILEVDALHIDVMDGHFVPQISFGNKFIQDIRKHSKLFFDVHLMIENPDRHIDSYIEAGADAITFHIESCNFSRRLIQYIRERYKNIKIGIAINPQTSPQHLLSLLEIIDIVLIMSVEPGFGGQKFITHTLDKIDMLEQMRTEMLSRGLKTNFEISIDGGVNLDTAPQIMKKPVDTLVVGSAFFSAKNKQEFVHEIRKIDEQ